VQNAVNIDPQKFVELVQENLSKGRPQPWGALKTPRDVTPSLGELIAQDQQAERERLARNL
jgi:hypothetical protein